MRAFLIRKYTLKATLALLMTLVCSLVFASPIIPIPSPPQASFIPTPPNPNAKSYVLMDAQSGKVLAEKEPDTRLPPASLTKLMSLYLISSALKNGNIHWDDKVIVSNKAWKMEGSRMFIKVGDSVSVKDLVQGIVVASGNDATVAMAEHIAGSEETFANMMNNQAKALGMNNTHYTDSTGLPNADHYSTARDFAILTHAYVKNFPSDYHLFSEKWFSYKGIRQSNRNRLLWRYPLADGLKTGHTSDAGYCLVASAHKGTMRLISVMLGAPSDQIRTEESIRMLTYGFRFFETFKLYDAKKPLVQARVWHGANKETPLILTEDLYATIPAGQFKKLQASIHLNNPIKAPIVKGQSYGSVDLTINNQLILSKPLVASEDNGKGNFWRRVTDSLGYKFHQAFSRPDDKVNTG